MPTYIRNSSDFFHQFLNFQFAGSSHLLFAMDMPSLYVSILYQDGSQGSLLLPGTKPESSPSTTTLLCLTEIVLTLNNSFQDAFIVIRKLSTWATFSAPVEEIKAADTNALMGRRWVTGKKRLSRLVRFVFAMAPYRLQQMLGFPVPSSLGQGEISDELRSSPNKPYGKGSKRKLDDLADEELCWFESLSCDLPEYDDSVEDPTYEIEKLSMTDFSP
ncbi:oogenesis-related [Hemiscyllium ocellatum]|uniref:oogenesis-related n=1 Tax=Hemiscyllium ocellatum TaxID=170820 RepID=UPI0029667D25|nr:oogenesis-related [Hemiscyllium ocellatum]